MTLRAICQIKTTVKPSPHLRKAWARPIRPQRHRSHSGGLGNDDGEGSVVLSSYFKTRHYYHIAGLFCVELIFTKAQIH